MGMHLDLESGFIKIFYFVCDDMKLSTAINGTNLNATVGKDSLKMDRLKKNFFKERRRCQNDKNSIFIIQLKYRFLSLLFKSKTSRQKNSSYDTRNFYNLRLLSATNSVVVGARSSRAKLN